MATGPNSDLLPVRKPTKEALAALKGRASYDEVLRVLLESVPADHIQRRLRVRRSAANPPAPPSAWREPEKQLLIARLAEESWRAWKRTGHVEDVGPRMVVWRTAQADKETRRLSIAWPERRGFSP